MAIWKKIFSINTSVKMNEPLSPEILSDPKHEFVKTMIYIYSMESFVFKELNIASREKNE